MKFAFVIGPYRGNTIYEMRENILSAEKLGAEISSYGVFAYVPHKNSAFYDGLQNDEFFLKANLEMLEKCTFNVGIVNYGWEHSSGSGGEIQQCKTLGIKILYREDPTFFDKLIKIRDGG